MFATESILVAPWDGKTGVYENHSGAVLSVGVPWGGVTVLTSQHAALVQVIPLCWVCSVKPLNTPCVGVVFTER